ncbi:P-loop containing nucleoside triphosphate hydrolase protein [Phellopilus nigrolimitatus]|nr:P-loop containing nucleoside triphosphate hydrolase protein [Phellopilus nigrolimitatus]
MRQRYAAELDEVYGLARKNKAGVKVSEEDGVDFGVIDTDSSLRHAATTRTITIEKVDRDARISLKAILTICPLTEMALSFAATIKASSRRINFGRPVSLEVTLKPSCVGQHVALLELTFHSINSKQEFIIIRELRALVTSSADHATLAPSAPYSPPTPIEPAATDSIHPGKRPVVWTKVKFTTRLPEYKAPAELIEAVFGQKWRGNIAEIKKKFMPGKLAMNTYYNHFQVCLHIEEENARRALAQRSLQNRTLEPKNHYYLLNIVEAKDPHWGHRVLVGDTLLFQHSDSSDETWYQGVIHAVEGQYKTIVKLRFSESFSVYRGKNFNVQFVLNRIPFRRSHQAVSDNYSLRRLLFPGINDKKINSISGEALAFFDRRIGQNSAQKDVVDTVLAMVPGCSPLVISGPPGTGKTSTVVEAIQQLVHRDPNARILACAQSNMAADVIASRLQAAGSASLLRLCAFSRPVDDMLPELRKVTCINANDVFAFPPLEQLAKFQIVVCTCVTGGVLRNMGLQRGHFNFIFIDEASQASEPIAMIPVKTIANNYTNLVLSGDKRQLGPSVHCIVARKLGLGTSYLERLMELGKDPASGVIVKPLKEHYRSHDAIIAFSNREFYDNELIPRGDPAVTHSLLRRDVLVNPEFPIVFHGVTGKDEREGHNPSFFNVAEAILVKHYVSLLMEDKKARLKEQHIGIISPYNAQCSKITRLLEKDWPEIKVGNVEDYQGQERRVIIISTVRSSVKQVSFDLRHNLGFVADPQRFNVAITRAQALLIVIGDPVVLSLDPLWRRYLNYIYLGGGWSPKGKRIDWDPNEDVTKQAYADERYEKARNDVQSFIERATSRILDNSDVLADGGPVRPLEAFMDRPWSIGNE